jgi:transposase
MVRAAALCPGCRQRDREIARLQKRVAQLENDNQQLRQLLDQERREHGRQAGRFRRRHLKKRPKRPGRKAGHPPAHRPTPTPEQIDRVIDVPCPQCPDCHVPLVDPGQVVQYQTDLPPIVPIVTQFNIETGYCPCCRTRRQGRHPEQISDAYAAAGNTFGPVILTMAAELKHRLGVPYRKICDFFSSYCDLHVCPGTFARADQRLALRAQPTYDLLIDALRRCGVVHADETGWRISRLNAWLWVFSNQDLTIYTIRTSRGHEVPEDILGPDFNGFLVVDGLNSYDVLEYAKSRCNAHLLRRCKDLRDLVPGRQHHHLQCLSDLLREAIALAGRRDELTPATYQRRVQEIEDRLDDWLDTVPLDQPDLDRLATHVARHRGEWLVFLHEAAVPPTNNHAERMLRPAVISRKVGGCNKTLLGALVHSILASVMVTCRQQGHRFLDLARRLWQSREPEAIALLPPPAS